MKYYVFVYGTLRRGCGNHALLQESEFIGLAKTKGKYTMYENVIPFVSKERETSQIIGEVYLVDEKTLARLDQLEAHPRWYRREEVEIILEDGRELLAWIYFNENNKGRIIKSGNYFINT